MSLIEVRSMNASKHVSIINGRPDGQIIEPFEKLIRCESTSY